MQSYSVQDVERVLRLSRSTIKGLIDGGFVKPERGPRRQYRFSFQDLIVLRTARALTQAKIPARRGRALEDLRITCPTRCNSRSQHARSVTQSCATAARWQSA
jgi:hypothetical protein